MRQLGWVVIMLAACGPSAPSASWPVLERTSETRSAPAAFLDVPGFTQTMVTHRHDNEFGTSLEQRAVVSREGRVVCEIPMGGSSAHCSHRSGEYAALDLRSRQPLRFEVRSTRHDSVISSGDVTCTCYELPADASCRTFVQRTCATDRAPSYSVSYRPGTGRIVGTVRRDDQPDHGAVVILGDATIVIDEHGAFDVALGVGTHELQLSAYEVIGTEPDSSIHRFEVKVTEHHDTVVELARDCRCCPP